MTINENRSVTNASKNFWMSKSITQSYLPTPLPACRHRVQRRPARPVAVGVGVKDRFDLLPPTCAATTVCATRSATVGTPRILVPPPCGFGISTASTGGGK